MAFIGEFGKVLESLRANGGHPLQRFLLERSGLRPEEIESYQDFTRIRPFTKGELSRLQAEQPPLAGLIDPGLVTKLFQSPGPIYNVKGAPYDHYRFHKALPLAGFTAGDIVLNTFSYHLSPAGEMFDEALEKIGAVTVPLGPTDSEKAAGIARAVGATGFIGTRSYLLRVLEQAGDACTLRKAYLIAEKLTEADREMFQKNFGVAAFQGYGIAEIGLIATEDQARDGWVVDSDALFLELVEPGAGNPVERGATGEVAVTFLNPVTPFLRLATGDLSLIHPVRPECLAGLFGRADSSVKAKGVFIHFWQFESFCEQQKIKARLVVESDSKGSDRLILHLPPTIDGETVATAFKKILGLSLSQVAVDDTIEKNEIRDQRTHLGER